MNNSSDPVKTTKPALRESLKKVPGLKRSYHALLSLGRLFQFAQFKKNQKLIRQVRKDAFSDRLLSVNWSVTEACNYRCSYCFFHETSSYQNKHLSIDDAKKAIKHIAGTDRPAYEITLTGGEASLNPDLPEIVRLLREHLGKSMTKIHIISNGSFESEWPEKILEAAGDTVIEIKISIHFEFVVVDHIIELIERYSDRIRFLITVMLHPEHFDEVKDFTKTMDVLRQQYDFALIIDLLREPPHFELLDHRYTDEHLIWKKETIKRFSYPQKWGSAHPYGKFLTDYKDDKEIRHKETYLSDTEAPSDYSGMYCVAGTSMINIALDGEVRGAICILERPRYNIFREDPFKKKDWNHAIPCTRKRCGCAAINWVNPKFISKEEAKDYMDTYSQKASSRPPRPSSL